MSSALPHSSGWPMIEVSIIPAALPGGEECYSGRETSSAENSAHSYARRSTLHGLLPLQRRVERQPLLARSGCGGSPREPRELELSLLPVVQAVLLCHTLTTTQC